MAASFLTDSQNRVEDAVYEAYCDTLRQTATHWKTLQNTVTHHHAVQFMLPYTVTYTATYCNTLQVPIGTVQHKPYCNMLQQTATRPSRLQYTLQLTHTHTNTHTHTHTHTYSTHTHTHTHTHAQTPTHSHTTNTHTHTNQHKYTQMMRKMFINNRKS